MRIIILSEIFLSIPTYILVEEKKNARQTVGDGRSTRPPTNWEEKIMNVAIHTKKEKKNDID